MHDGWLWYSRQQETLLKTGSLPPSQTLLTVFFVICNPAKMPPIPVAPESCSHVLAEFDCLDPLLSALRLDSGRLKVRVTPPYFMDGPAEGSGFPKGGVLSQCTCLAVSRKWLALGTSAGGLHLIQREGWKQKLILTHKVTSSMFQLLGGLHIMKGDVHLLISFPGRFHHSGGLLPSR